MYCSLQCPSCDVSSHSVVNDQRSHCANGCAVHCSRQARHRPGFEVTSHSEAAVGEQIL